MLSNLLPRETSRTVHAYLEGKTGESRDLFFKYADLTKTVMGVDGNPTGIKAALSLRGMMAEEFRLPVVPVTPESKDLIRKQMDKLGLLSGAAAR